MNIVDSRSVFRLHMGFYRHYVKAGPLLQSLHKIYVPTAEQKHGPELACCSQVVSVPASRLQGSLALQTPSTSTWMGPGVTKGSACGLLVFSAGFP